MYAVPPPPSYTYIGVFVHLSLCPGGCINSIKQHPAVRLTDQCTALKAAGLSLYHSHCSGLQHTHSLTPGPMRVGTPAAPLNKLHPPIHKLHSPSTPKGAAVIEMCQ